MITDTRKRHAYIVYLFLEGASSAFFALWSTLSAVYRVTYAGLNPLQLLLLGTALEAAVFLCEIPTGVVADVYSRRLSVIIGTAMMGAGFVLEGAIPQFATILLAQVIWGIGYTFTSGAQQAWITDEVGEEHVRHIFLRSTQLSQIGALLGVVGSVVLASIRLNLPLLVGGALMMALALALVLVMPERRFQRATREERSSWRDMAETVRKGGRLIRRRPALLTIFGAVAFYGASSEGFDRLWEAHLLTNFTFPAFGHLTPVIWFGLIDVVAMLITIGVTEVVRRWVRTETHIAAVRVLFAINVLLIAGVVSLGVAGSFALAVAAYLLTTIVRQVRTPIYDAWLTVQAEPGVRATLLSMSSQVDAIGQVIGGPIVGAIGTALSIRAALVAAGAALSPSLLLFTRAAKQGEPESAPAVARDVGVQTEP